VVSRHDYLPFGQEWIPAASADRVRFAGKEHDLETGTSGGWTALDYFGARYLHTSAGRFTSVDPFFTIPENIADPQRWNRYTYGLNSPFRFVDPDGRETQLVVGKHTKDNPVGHVAIAINGVVFSYGTDYTKGENRDWGVSLENYLAAQASLRQTELLTLKVSPDVEKRLLGSLRAHNPYAPGAPAYDVMTHSCVTICVDELEDVSVLLERMYVNARGEEAPASMYTPGELAARVRANGLVEKSTTVGTESVSWWTSLWNAITR
jgi:RHS repeat-associated protein